MIKVRDNTGTDENVSSVVHSVLFMSGVSEGTSAVHSIFQPPLSVYLGYHALEGDPSVKRNLPNVPGDGTLERKDYPGHRDQKLPIYPRLSNCGEGTLGEDVLLPWR
jgi:hypothetical protein